MRSSSRPRPRSARLLKEASTAIRPPTPSSSMPSRECWPRRPACCCRRTCLPSRQIAGANVPGGDFQKSSIKIPGYEFSFVPLSPTQDAGGAPRAKNTAPLPPHHSFIAPIYAPHSRGGVTDYMKRNLVFARRGLMAIGAALMAVVLFSWPSTGAPGGQASDLFPLKWLPAAEQFDLSSSGMSGAGGQFSTQQIERFTCTTSGPPTAGVIMNCNVPEFNQNFSPDNEIAVVVDPDNPNHIVAGSNDYYYRFNNSTGARQAIVPTGFFTSFDGGASWLDGQVPMRFGNGAGDPSPAFDKKHNVVLMSQLENVGGPGGPWVAHGDVPVVAPNGTLYVHFTNGQNSGAWEQPFDFDSQIMVVKSTDGGVTFSAPVPAVQLEDGLSDMPFSVIRRQTVYGHQIRWNAAGTLVADSTDPSGNTVSIVFADPGAPKTG